METPRVEEFDGKQEQHDFHREGAAVAVVAVEDIRVGGRGQPAEVEDVEQIVVLAVSVSTDGEFGFAGWFSS